MISHNLDNSFSTQNKFKYSVDFSECSSYDYSSRKNHSENTSPIKNSDLDSIINDSTDSKSSISSAFIDQTSHHKNNPLSDSDSSSFNSTTHKNKKLIRLEEEDFIKIDKDQDLDKIPPSLNISTSPLETTQHFNTTDHNKVGSFNIQNQFDHMAAGELFLKGDFSLLSFQEP